VTLRVRNRLKDSTSIHWHGIILPANMDGVPGLSFHGIEPGGVYVYQFKVRQNGTYWYHSHSGLQEQAGVYGPLVIDAKEPEPFQYDRDYVVMLSDWTDEDPASLMATLKKQSDYYNYHKRTVGDFIDDVSDKGWRPPSPIARCGRNEDEPHRPRRRQRRHLHLPDQRPRAGRQLDRPVSPGEKLRLRLINGSAMTYFDVRIPG
jgi:FtsP/CotA-like multicopper oxidase with cupredoxin domain